MARFPWAVVVDDAPPDEWHWYSHPDEAHAIAHRMASKGRHVEVLHFGW
jgi:hypothetical protein